MQRKIHSILVCGLGKVGSLMAFMLHETGFEVTGVDLQLREEYPFSVKTTDVSNTDELAKLMRGFDAVVSCLPYNFNLGIATLASEHGIHY